MPDEYISTINLEINGRTIEDWKTFTEGEREIRREIKLARKIGAVKVVSGFPLEMNYVVPKNAPEIDFEAEFATGDGTLTVDYDNGTRHVYTGVTLLKVGATEYDGEKEVVRPISFLATKRTKS